MLTGIHLGVAGRCCRAGQASRHTEDTIVRELANEALARCPVSVLTALLNDPVDAETARAALRRQVVEYGSEEARLIINALDQVDEL